MAIKTAGLHTQITRRTALGGVVAAMAAAPALAEDCRIGPPPHEKGPLVWMDMDQLELDAAYDQAFYAPLRLEVIKRLVSTSEAVRGRIGQPVRESYGPTEVEKLDIYRTKRANAPIFVFIHGGAWLGGEAKNYAFAAEMFVNAGAHYVALDFIAIKEAGGDLRVMADQVRRGIAWVYNNAEKFGGDRDRFYWRPFVGRASLRRRPRHGLAKVLRVVVRHGEGWAVHEWHVRHEARPPLEAQLLRQIQRRHGAGNEFAALP
jgi:arylformamidase